MTALDRMIRMYDSALVSRDYKQYFDDSGFYNFGYWDGQAKTQREACEALVDKLADKIPNKGGCVLDVACGLGATTSQLTRYYAPENITAINIAKVQIAEARKRVPRCSFYVMDAVMLDFPEDQFDALICVEAAFHFNTRDRFFQEALRVLKPGGSLVLSDMLFRGFMKPIGEFGQVPRANFVPDVPAYQARMEMAGFKAVAVQDVTEACLGGFRRHLARWPASEYRRGRMKFARMIGASIMSRIIARYFGTVCGTYLIASASKPSHRNSA